MNFSESLLVWYAENRRLLPWRENRTPYTTLVSELMLQQTRVESVKDKFKNFLEQYPTVEKLADSNEDDVLKSWEGLGYYSRAKNLRKAAIAVLERGGFPSEPSELAKLPGVGEYTSKAIASMAFHKPFISVDGNLIRVYSRLNADGGEAKSREMKQRCESFFLGKMDQADPGDFNEALMDLGEMVCLPNGAPLCLSCPLSPFCLAHKNKQEVAYPKLSKPTAKKRVEITVFLLFYQGKIAIRKRSDKGLLSSLYEFPNEEGFLTKEAVSARFKHAAIADKGIKRHVFTHLIWEMKTYQIHLNEKPEDPALLWVETSELDRLYALPTAFKKLL